MYDNIRALGSAYGHLATIQFYKGSVDTATSYFRKSIALNTQIEARLGISESCLHFGEAFLELGMYDSAAYYLNKGISYSVEVHDYYTMDNFYKSLSKVYEARGQLDSALYYYKKLQDVRDTLFNLNKSNIVSEMQTELANERSLREIEVLKEKDVRKSLILYASIGLGVLLLLLVVLAYNRFLVKKRSALLLEKQNTEIQEQKEIIEEKNKDVTDSIHYAKRIQNAILPSNDRITELFPSSWCYFVPKDIVSGDFYRFEKEGEYKLFGAVDCTGHGVPGALLSVVGHNLLGKALTDLKLVMPDKILAFLDGEIHKTLRHKDAMNENSVQDGMDIALCCYHEKLKTIYYSGAANPMYMFPQGELLEFKADKIMIGSGDSARKNFTIHEIKVESGDEIILFTDSYADQFGGPFGKKMKYNSFKEMLLSIQELSMAAQSVSVTNSFKEWKKEFDQVDDVCVLAIRIG